MLDNRWWWKIKFSHMNVTSKWKWIYKKKWSWSLKVPDDALFAIKIKPTIFCKAQSVESVNYILTWKTKLALKMFYHSQSGKIALDLCIFFLNCSFFLCSFSHSLCSFQARTVAKSLKMKRWWLCAYNEISLWEHKKRLSCHG